MLHPAYIVLPGLPDSINHSEMKEVWTRMWSSGTYTLHPVSLLVALLPSATATTELALKWKFSRAERLLAEFVASHRELAYDKQTTAKDFQDMLVDKAPPGHVEEVLHYCGRASLASELREWPVPQFPLSGHDIQAFGVPPGPKVGQMLKLAREKWKGGNFLPSRDELEQYVISVVRHKN